MKRLTTHLNNGHAGIRGYTPDWEVVDRLAEYEDMEEQGLLVRLPCKLGGTVFFPMETDGECEPFVDVGMVFAIGIDENHTMWISVRYKSGLKYYHTADVLGRTVFLTREEAEKALEDAWKNT